MKPNISPSLPFSSDFVLNMEISNDLSLEFLGKNEGPFVPIRFRDISQYPLRISHEESFSPTDVSRC